jgi:hypothetical protein
MDALKAVKQRHLSNSGEFTTGVGLTATELKRKLLDMQV